ncbi:hypothetical protein D3C76_1070200 [compost metagenome]
MEVSVPVAVTWSGFDVTTYPVTGLPPFSVGGVKLTVAAPSPAVAVIFVGTPGTVFGVALTSLEYALSPPG